MKIEFRDKPYPQAIVKYDFWDRILLSIPKLRDWYSRHLGRKIEEALRKKEAEEHG